MKHPIDRYCDEQGITRAELARRAGVSPQFLADVVSGRRSFGRQSAVAVVSATNGGVTLAELLMPPAEDGEAA